MHFFRKMSLIAFLLAGAGSLAAETNFNAVYPLDGDGTNLQRGGVLQLDGAEFGPGVTGRALKLDGSRVFEVLSADKMRTLIGEGEFAVSILCRPGRQDKYRLVMAQATASPADRSFWIGYHPGLNRFDFLVRGDDGKTQTQVHGISNVDRDGWNLVIASAGSGELRIMSVPLAVDSFPGRMTKLPLLGRVRSAGVPLTLGGRSGEPENGRFQGMIGEIAFWNGALDIKEMAAIFEQYKSGKTIGKGFRLEDAVKSSSFKPAELPYFAPGKRELFREKPLTLESGKSYVAPCQIASGDFRVECMLSVPALKQSVFQVDIGADGFLFDGPETTLRSVGSEGINTFRAQPVSVNFGSRLSGGQPFRFVAEKKAGVLTLRLDGSEVFRVALPRDTIGEVAVSVRKGSVELKEFMIDASLLKGRFVPVFQPGENGSAVYRIPALTVAKDGTLLAFAEARHDSMHDLGDIDIVFKRSDDGGKNWAPLQTVIRGERGTKLSSVNPGPVVDPVSGRIHLFCYQGFENKWASGEYRLLHSFSDDNGVNWSEPVDHKPQLPDNWLSFQPGPGHAIVLRHGRHKGRIIVPGWYVYRKHNEKVYASALIYSDDNGKTFQGGGTGMDGSDECLVAELADGSVIMGIRPPQRGMDSEFRHFAVSRDGGESFDPCYADKELRATICQAGLVSSNDGRVLYFSYPAGGNYEREGETRRAGLTLRKRMDGGPWSAPRLIYAGRSGYSDLALFGDDRIGIIFEGGRYSSYKDGILFTSVER